MSTPVAMTPPTSEDSSLLARDVDDAALDNVVMQQLQGDQAPLLDAIDKLRKRGIDQIVDLPQLIVCGDQSSGKSSVLEALSRVRFPVKSGVCTRFATELILRRNATKRLEVSIVPKSTSGDQQRVGRLSQFSYDAFDAGALPDLIEKAKSAMGISDNDPNAFSQDVLRIEISGPDKPHLTVVDLPGIYHATSIEQGEKGITLVTELVRDYMKNKNSIILAVVSAKSEYHLQKILNMAKEHDPDRTRTMGIITKPDTLEGPDQERAFVKLARNEGEKLKLGWHVLRNRRDDEKLSSDQERDSVEAAFFGKGVWMNMPRNTVGVDQLRKRLSSVLLQHIRSKLPELIRDLETKRDEVQHALRMLGEARMTPEQQRTFLFRVVESFQALVGSAIEGSYRDAFFAESDDFKLRAVVRSHNRDFELAMQWKGHSRLIKRDALDLSEIIDVDPIAYDDLEVPEEIEIDAFVHEVEQMARKNRGVEFPDDVTPHLVGELFRQQAQPWEVVGKRYLDTVWESLKSFLYFALEHSTQGGDPTIFNSIWNKIMDSDLERIRQQLDSKLQELLHHHKKGEPIVLDEYYTQIRWISDSLHGLVSQISVEDEAQFKKLLFAVNQLARSRSSVATGSGALTTIDRMETYYKMAMRTFVDNMCILAVENCMMKKLPQILTHTWVGNMGVEDLQVYAGESEVTTAERKRLQAQSEAMEAALKQFRRFKEYQGPEQRLYRPRVAPNRSVSAQNPAIKRNADEPDTQDARPSQAPPPGTASGIPSSSTGKAAQPDTSDNTSPEEMEPTVLAGASRSSQPSTPSASKSAPTSSIFGVPTPLSAKVSNNTPAPATNPFAAFCTPNSSSPFASLSGSGEKQPGKLFSFSTPPAQDKEKGKQPANAASGAAGIGQAPTSAPKLFGNSVTSTWKAPSASVPVTSTPVPKLQDGPGTSFLTERDNYGDVSYFQHICANEIFKNSSIEEERLNYYKRRAQEAGNAKSKRPGDDLTRYPKD